MSPSRRSSTAPLPTTVTATVGARLTLPASTSEEAVRGSGRQVRILRAPTLALLQELVTRELRAHAMSLMGEGRATKRRAGQPGGADVALEVITCLDRGDFRGAIVAHVTGFGLGVVLPPQLGGALGESFELPAPGSRRRAAVLEDAETDVESDETASEVSIAA